MHGTAKHGFWSYLAGLFHGAPKKTYVRQFASELLEEYGRRDLPEGLSNEGDLIFWLQKEGLLFRCDWKDTVDTCGEDIAGLVCAAGADKAVVDECLNQQSWDDPVFEFAIALNDAFASDGVTLLEIDEQSDGCLYCAVRPDFVQRWESTRLSNYLTVFRAKSANDRIPRGLNDGPRQTGVVQ